MTGTDGYPFPLRRRAGAECHVGFLNLVMSEGFHKFRGHFVRLGYNRNATGVTIETVSEVKLRHADVASLGGFSFEERCDR